MDHRTPPPASGPSEIYTIAMPSLMKSAAFYATLAFTPLSSMLFGFTTGAPGMAALIFGLVDVFRKVVVNPLFPKDLLDWEKDTMPPGGDYTNLDTLWSDFKIAASCKACLVQALIYFGVISFSGMFGAQAAGLAATSFVSTVLYDFLMGFLPRINL